jgi:hypothetical protein
MFLSGAALLLKPRPRVQADVVAKFKELYLVSGYGRAMRKLRK